MTENVKDIDDVLPPAIGQLDDSEDWIGKPLVVQGAQFRIGQYGPFAIVNAVSEDGETVRFSCGSEIVVEQLRDLAANRAYPVRAILSQQTATGSGRNFLALVSAKQPAASA